MQRCYVDNAYNRKLGRVGKPLGTHVVHSNGSSGASAVHVSHCSGFSSGASAPRCYVDNAYNRKLGRVGKPLGTHVVHSNGSGSGAGTGLTSGASGPRCYVDNAYNRKLGRVGKPLGTHVVHSNGSSGASTVHVSGCTSAPSYGASDDPRCYVDNAYNRKLGRVGKPLGTHVVHSNGRSGASTVHVSGCTSAASYGASDDPRCYVDNAYNRKLGRVGKPLGTHVVHSNRGSAASTVCASNWTVPVQTSNRAGSGAAEGTARSYVGNAPNRVEVGHIRSSGERTYVHNRHLGRVGKRIQPRSAESQETHTLENLLTEWCELGSSNPHCPVCQSVLDRIEKVQVEVNWAEKGIDLKNPSTFTHPITEIIPYDELQVENVIGHGGFGVVYACLWLHKPVAFKRFLHQNIMTKKRQEKFEKEIKILASLDHPDIVKMFGAVIERGKIGVLMEYMECSLFQALFIDNIEFSEAKKKQIVSQLATALCYLHKHEPTIAHCDIKSGNVLLDRDNNAKLSDFGLSSIKCATEASRSSAAAPPAQGTPRYSAPEVLRGEILILCQLVMADVYSLAIVAFEVVVEEEPFENFNARQLEANVGHGNLRPTSEEVKLSESLLNLLSSSWDSSAAKRPTAEEFKEKWGKISDLIN